MLTFLSLALEAPTPVPILEFPAAGQHSGLFCELACSVNSRTASDFSAAAAPVLRLWRRVVIAVRYLSDKDDRVYAHDWASLSRATLCSCHQYPSLGSVHLCCLKFRGCSAVTSLPLCIASSRNTPEFPVHLTHPGSSHKWNHTGTAFWHLL